MKPIGKHDAGRPRHTFKIAVSLGQNATWQGEIFWAEKNMKQDFYCVMEMLKLMDDALIDGKGEIGLVKWGKGSDGI